MKITQQTSTILKLQVQKYFQTLLMAIGLGLGFSLTGLIMTVVFGNSTTLNCNRLESAQIDCEINRKNWLTRDSDLIQVTDLRSAELDVNSRNRSGRQRNDYEIILITNNNRIPLTNTYSSGFGFNHEKQNQLINSFITASAPDSLTVRHNMRLGLIIGIIFLFVSPVLAINLLLSKRITDCTFDKASNQLLINQRNLFKKQSKEYTMSQIQKVKAMQHLHYGCIIKIFLTEDEEIEFRPFSYNSKKRQETYDKYDLMVQKINQFIETDA
ncbi:MAG: hypothetical protein WBA77_11045 [Microcoleaceae cyanobacterium]